MRQARSFFRDVELVRWPAICEPSAADGSPLLIIHQPLTELAAALDAAGKLDYVLNERELILFAYRRCA